MELRDRDGQSIRDHRCSWFIVTQSPHFWLHLSVTALNDVGMMVGLKFSESLGAGGGNAQWHCGIFRKPRAGPVFWFAMAVSPQGLSGRVIYYSAIISASLHLHVDFQYVQYCWQMHTWFFTACQKMVHTVLCVVAFDRRREVFLRVHGKMFFIHNNVNVRIGLM